MNPENYSSVEDYIDVALAEFDKKYAELECFEKDPEIREFYKQVCKDFFYEVKSGRLNKIEIMPEPEK